jgi:hypothetical protein
VDGSAGGQKVLIKINDHGKVIFGTCGCEFFRENILNLGPCEHMLALFELSRDQRVDQPTSTETEAAETRRAPQDYQLDDEGEEEFDDEDE